jgi:hypothetical protein
VGWLMCRENDAQPAAYQPEISQPLRFKPVARIAEEPRQISDEPVPQSPGARTYKNTETWDIEWTPDGLPGKVTIHRNAVQT